MLPTRFATWAILVGSMIFDVGLVYAQDFPTRPIRILTSKVGTGSDILARTIADAISAPLGQRVIVDNRANFVEIMLKAPPDGYNLMLDGISLWIMPMLQQTSYDMMRDFTPVVPVMRQTSVLAVTPSLPVNSVKELIALAKAKPGQLNYAMGGVGTLAHLTAELFRSMAGINVVRVQYASSAQADTELISGQVQMTFGGTSTVMPHVKLGKLKALAVTSTDPSPFAPGVPPLANTLPGYEGIGFQGIYAPARMPEAIARRLNQEIVRSLSTSEAKERFATLNAEIMTSSSEQFTNRVRSEITKWDKVLKEAGIRVQ